MKKQLNNLVAKHCMKFNRAVVERDKKNDYVRKEKHKKNWSGNNKFRDIMILDMIFV